MELLRTEKINTEDSPHEVYSIDGLLDRHAVTLHRFDNAAGVPYSAVYRNGVEEMSAERERESVMLAAFRRRLFEEVTGGAGWGKLY